MIAKEEYSLAENASVSLVLRSDFVDSAFTKLLVILLFYVLETKMRRARNSFEIVRGLSAQRFRQTTL